MIPGNTVRWFHTRRPVSKPRVRLICLPYAGGGAPTFHRWPDEVPGDVEVCVAQLPARHTRISEPGLTSVGAVVARLATALESKDSAPLAIYGHSFGGLVGFELARRLIRDNRTLVHLIVGSRTAPQLALSFPPISHLPDIAFCQELHRRYGGGDVLLQNPDLMSLALPSLRADLTAYESYRYVADRADDRPPLAIPITALGGRQDGSVSPERLAAWRAMTSGSFDTHWIDASHFFVDSHRAWVIERVTEALARH